jgi:predicted nucleic acid-binding protein
MIFLDTSAIYAWADTADSNHKSALRRLQRMLSDGESFVTHNYVLVEALALLQARLGLEAALKFTRDSKAFVIEWVDDNLHDEGLRELARVKSRRISLVDHISFLVMRRRGLTAAFAFDDDFAAAGFTLVDD